MPHEQIAELVTEYRDAPQRLADALVDAATARYANEQEDRDLFAERAEEAMLR